MHRDLFLADNGGNIRSSQAFLDDEWEPEPIEALTGEFMINHE